MPHTPDSFTASVRPMQKENRTGADEAYSTGKLTLPRSYCRRSPGCAHRLATNMIARATKPDADPANELARYDEAHHHARDEPEPPRTRRDATPNLYAVRT